MRTVLSYLRIASIQSLQYRSELLIWIWLTVANTLILLIAWGSIFAASPAIRGYSLASIVQYYLIIMFIDMATAVHFESWRVQEVREGRIDLYLSKPVGYPLQILLQDLGGKLFWLTLAIPTLTVTFLVLHHFIPDIAFTLTPASLISFLPLLLFGFCLEFCAALATVFAGFWIEGADGLQHFKWMVFSLFSGFLVPVPLMPGWLRAIVEFLPFKYLYAVPAGVLQGTTALTLRDGVTLLAVAAGAIAAVYWLWGKARAQYASAGG